MSFSKEHENNKSSQQAQYKVNGYVLIQQIGTGSFCTVYSGMSPKNDAVAIKVIDKENITKLNPQISELLEFEVKTMKSLVKYNCKNILKFIDSFDKGSVKYIITELCQKETLLDELSKVQRFSESKAMNYFLQIKEGLYYMHIAGIAHRDLKLPNILFGLDNYIKIADFGFSKEKVQNEEFQSVLGTMTTIAPEVLQQKGYTLQAVILGQILTKMLFGRYLFHIQDFLKNFNSLQNFIDENIEKNCQQYNISDSVKDLISNLLKVNPVERWSMENIVKVYPQKCYEIMTQYAQSTDPQNKILQKQKEYESKTNLKLSQVIQHDEPRSAVDPLLSVKNRKQSIGLKGEAQSFTHHKSQNSTKITQSGNPQALVKKYLDPNQNINYPNQHTNKSISGSLQQNQPQVQHTSFQQRPSSARFTLQTTSEEEKQNKMSSSVPAWKNKRQPIQGKIEKMLPDTFEQEQKKMKEIMKGKEDIISLMSALQSMLLCKQIIEKCLKQDPKHSDKYQISFIQRYCLYIQAVVLEQFKQLNHDKHRINETHKQITDYPFYKEQKSTQEKYIKLLEQLFEKLAKEKSTTSKILKEQLTNQIEQLVQHWLSQLDQYQVNSLLTVLYFHFKLQDYLTEQKKGFFKINLLQNIQEFLDTDPQVKLELLQKLFQNSNYQNPRMFQTAHFIDSRIMNNQIGDLYPQTLQAVQNNNNSNNKYSSDYIIRKPPQQQQISLNNSEQGYSQSYN